jgi:nucleoside-diphosphate-sugar epimerase
MILVTGGSGFVGASLLSQLASTRPGDVRASVRRDVRLPEGVRAVSVDSLSAQTQWADAVRDVRVVVHCAARAHVMREPQASADAAFHEVNVEGTLNLAQQAAAAGVRRFIYLSSVKVHGERTQPNQPFTEADAPAPEDAYGKSKAESEIRLTELAHEWACNL